MKRILEKLAHNPAVEVLLRDGNEIGNLNPIEEALLIAATYEQKKKRMLIVKSNQYTAQKLMDRLIPLTSAKVLLFSVEDSLRVEAIASSPESKAVQLETMNAMLEGEADIVITHAAGLIRYLPSVDFFQQCSLHLKVNQTISMEELKERLFYAGYELVARVDQPLTYAHRGGIIDVFSMNQNDPIRIEFFDNEIESIRYFDITTQRTISLVDEIKIIPASDLLFSDDDIAQIVSSGNEKLEKAKRDHSDLINQTLDETINTDFDGLMNHVKENHYYRYYALCSHETTIKDYFDATIYLSSIDDVEEKIKRIQEETIAYIQELVKEGRSLPIYSLFASLQKALGSKKVVEFQSFVDMHSYIISGIQQLDMADLSLELKLKKIIEEAKENTVLLCLNETESALVSETLKNMHEKAGFLDEKDSLKQGLFIVKKELYEGFSCTHEHVIVYSSKELFNERRIIGRHTNKFNKAQALTSYEQLQKGDYVVHQQHGIGMYNGIVTREFNGLHKDYLQIIFRNDDVLFVPLEQFRLVRKFISKEGATPKLNKLGSKEWQNTKKKISEDIKELAQRLVALYSLREENIGFAFSKDNEDQQRFEDEFEYELTDDQKQAVAEMKKDMESSKPMDRLLCGDVGFGKTEVAIRGAYKAVNDQKQVAFLCPTTILSQQHYKVFKHRFQNEAVNIEVLNRFVTPKEQTRILRDLKEGKIDILIGTHRILSKDVVFKDLGFLIIDEEQRFGVQHKERIKELKSSIDVLSLSATPIPRTLQMSLIGVRGLSQLETPPKNRQSVQTYVLEKNPRMINEIIQRELARDGQVFYLYNNVNNIYSVASKIRKDLDVEVGVVHGQMDKESIEDVMVRFVNNEFKVLVCTTIIETGIDIPNANTIIIENADTFGLSQLYQIKGRVGRSDRLAYAYLFYKPNKQLSEVAQKRLKAIKEFATLGSGYKIAMRDLTIRGAGDMLGDKQAGFIDTVGMDMYIEMLNEAINEEKGIKKEEPKQIIKTNVSVDAYIPKHFSDEDYEKITFYQNIDKIQTKEELLTMMEETKDNFGKLPKEVQYLFEKRRLDILVSEEGVESFKEYPKEVELIFTKQYSDQMDGVKLFEIITSISREIVVRYSNSKMKFKIPKRNQWLETVIEVIERSKEALKA
ncbi:transcription-repair coupling factor [Traorella massiliensis]|uniref:transcription-repair coupling factor n=1 Tax=Traorella massiliensis TaxID=1903263 RepID=UPI00248D829E|nr:transcription-repair coupling factor [Traorella massiliensis]